MKLLMSVLLWSALGLPASCYHVEHYVDDPSRMDGLYFGPAEGHRQPEWEDDNWRIYALFGLVAWSEKDTWWAGTYLSGIGPGLRPQSFHIVSGVSFLNGLSALGLAAVTGILQPLLFVPWSTEVAGRKKT